MRASINRIVFGVHVWSVATGYGLFALCCFERRWTIDPRDGYIALELVLLQLGGIGFLTGVVLMLQRRGEAEDIALCVSTVAAIFLVMLVSLCAVTFS